MSTELLLTAAGSLTAGYLAGRINPLHRIWTWGDRMSYRPLARRHIRWWLAMPIWMAMTAVCWITEPRRTLHRWRHRNDPRPAQGPVIVTDLTTRRPTAADPSN
ncbi:hypothetical protein [Streptomyces xiamenensis]|uniref:hypothetical protein n=1 Tax=Streptomyces xiamenensis TaxID=408015 RepID=UPI0035E355C8